MELLLARSFVLLVLFQLLAIVVLVADRRGRGTLVAVFLAAVVGVLMAVQRSADPGLFFASALGCALLVSQAARRGAGVWRTALAGVLPVVAASALAFTNGGTAESSGSLREQFEEMARVASGTTPGREPSGRPAPDRPAGEQTEADSLPALAPEEQQWRQRSQELASLAAGWAMRLLPAGVVGMAMLQTLLVVATAGRLAKSARRPTGIAPVDRWQVPFGAIWGLVAGLGMVAVRQPVAVVVGLNLVVIVALWLAVQGFAVFIAALGRSVVPGLRGVTLVLATVTTLLAWPLVAFGLALLGLLDLWVDFRKLRPASEDS